MTHYSLEMLQKKEHKDGFLLFVEGWFEWKRNREICNEFLTVLDGLIGEALKEGKINEALEQVSEYSIALNMAHMMTKTTDTLVLSMDVGNPLLDAELKVSIKISHKFK